MTIVHQNTKKKNRSLLPSAMPVAELRLERITSLSTFFSPRPLSSLSFFQPLAIALGDIFIVLIRDEVIFSDLVSRQSRDAQCITVADEI